MSDLHLSDNVIMNPDYYIVLLIYIYVSLAVGLLFLSNFSDEGLLLETSVELVFCRIGFIPRRLLLILIFSENCFLHRLPTLHTYLLKSKWLGLNGKSTITKI